MSVYSHPLSLVNRIVICVAEDEFCRETSIFVEVTIWCARWWRWVNNKFKPARVALWQIGNPHSIMESSTTLTQSIDQECKITKSQIQNFYIVLDFFFLGGGALFITTLCAVFEMRNSFYQKSVRIISSKKQQLVAAYSQISRLYFD